MLTKEDKQRLLDTLAQLGGRANKDDDIVFEGTKLVIPERMSLQQAGQFIKDRIEADEATTVFQRDYPYRPWDGAYNASQAMARAFGMVNAKTLMGFFGPEPPQQIRVNVGPDATIEVPWGAFSIPMLEGATIHFGQKHHPEYGLIFAVQVEAPRKYRHHIEGLLQLIDEELRANSIYRGRAFDGQQMPEFLDLTGVNPEHVIYSEDVQTQLEANLWSLLRHTESHKTLGLPLKRAVLLAGPYGTGKTLAAFRTAQEAVENGWAFIYARPGRDDFREVLQTARLYQPAVVFIEDADTIASPDGASGDAISMVLDLFDGITAKGTNIAVVLTTNHPDKLHKGMLRPGRLDAVVEIGPLDEQGVRRLVLSVLDGVEELDINWEAVHKACEGYLPAFIKEAAGRAVRYVLARNGGDTDFLTITTDDLVRAANGLRPQFDRMTGASEATGRDSVEAALRATVEKAVASLAPTREDDINYSVWSPEKLLAAQNGRN